MRMWRKIYWGYKYVRCGRPCLRCTEVNWNMVWKTPWCLFNLRARGLGLGQLSCLWRLKIYRFMKKVRYHPDGFTWKASFTSARQCQIIHVYMYKCTYFYMCACMYIYINIYSILFWVFIFDINLSTCWESNFPSRINQVILMLINTLHHISQMHIV